MNWSELTVEGGSLAAGLLAMGLAVATVGVGTWVAYVAYSGYRESGDRPTLVLAVGIALASAVHTSARIALPTAGASSPVTDTAAVAIQVVGLVLVLYAIYGRPEHADRRVLGGIVAGGILLCLAPLVAVDRAIIAPSTVVAGVNGLAAVVGGFVATQAYRGYRRYDSRPMLLLAGGILLLTVGSLIAGYVTDALWAASDAMVLAVIGSVELVGLLLILQSLTND